MLQDAQFKNIIYFLVFFKFVFVIFYTVYLYGMLFDHMVYENTHKWVVVIEAIFLILMSLLLLFRYSKDVIQVDYEERLLLWTMTFCIVLDSIIKVSQLDWF
jgi:hypothetical protein